MCQQWLEAFEAALGPGLQSVELLQVSLVAEERQDLFKVLAHGGHHAVRGAGFMLGRDLRCVEVEAGDLRRQLVDVCGSQFAVGLQGAEQPGLGELAHFQYVFDGRAVTAQLRRFGAASHRQHFQVKIIGQALVQAQFFATEMLARFQGREVEETKIHRFLHFIGKVASQQYPGDVGLDELEPVYGMRVEGRVLQGGDQGLAHRRSFRVWKNSGRHYGV
ncbi:hypothetical protein D3C86_1621800 [compost metagenome]